MPLSHVWSGGDTPPNCIRKALSLHRESRDYRYGRDEFEGVPVSDFETWSPVPNHTVPMLGVYTVGGALMVAMVTRDRPNGRKADQFLDAYLKELPGQCFPAAYKERDTA